MNNHKRFNLRIISKRKKGLPSFKQLKYLKKYLNKTEKTILKIALLIFLLSFGYFIYTSYSKIENIPNYGGSYIEGIIGQMQYLNPVLADTNSVDVDINKLIYNSLFKTKNRELVPDVVESYEISEDGKKYSFILKSNIFWHDNKPLTSEDIVFTINTIKDIKYRSPLYLSLKDVAVEKTGTFTFDINLQKAYNPLISTLTFGIIPKHIWSNINSYNFALSEYNLKPVGTGPYKFESLTKSKEGFIKSYTLQVNDLYFRKKPYIEEFTFKFFNDKTDLIERFKEKKVTSINYIEHSEKSLLNEKNANFYNLYLPKYDAIFINSETNELLKQDYIRESICLGTDKYEIIEDVFENNAKKSDSLFPEDMLGYDPNYTLCEFNPSKAVSIIENNGWVRSLKDGIMEKDGGKLEFILTTVNNEDNEKVANIIKKQWENLGIKLNIQLIDNNFIKEETIKPRNYDLLLYGEVVGANSDPYAFWHSSQSKNPGLNLSVYGSSSVDEAIEKARQAISEEDVLKEYKTIKEIFKNDIPAIFLYNNSYIYTVSNKVYGINLNENITYPYDRFNNIEEWYVKTKKRF